MSHPAGPNAGGTDHFGGLEKTEGSRPNVDSLNEAFDLGNGHTAVHFRAP
jgi:hypothetical protein